MSSALEKQNLCKAKTLDRDFVFLYNQFRYGDAMSLERIVKKGELLDCYGMLLTKRQRECLSLYYNENLTLAEIAEYFHISRQAVHDAMRHGDGQLMLYEAALHLSEMKQRRTHAAEELLALLPMELAEKAKPFVKTLIEGR